MFHAACKKFKESRPGMTIQGSVQTAFAIQMLRNSRQVKKFGTPGSQFAKFSKTVIFPNYR